MNITITGSLGHISKPLVETLIKKGHDVKVISSSKERKSAIEALGATPAIGDLEDVAFLTESFKGADAVYTMVPPNNYFDHDLDLLAYYKRLGKNYTKAIIGASVTHIVNLSTIGGHLAKGNGILKGAHDVEQTLNQLPDSVAITHIRPTAFYYNLYGYMEMIKSDQNIYVNYGNHPIPWVAPKDIAQAVATELTDVSLRRKTRYVVSEELTGKQTAKVLGEALGISDLQWSVIDNEVALNGLTTIGMNPEIAAGLIEMYATMRTGLLLEDYHKNKPEKMGNVKLSDFARGFAEAYQNNQ